MNAQQYEELFVATACVAYGILSLWVPAAVRWPHGPGRKRGFGIFALVAGVLVAVAAVLGR